MTSTRQRITYAVREERRREYRERRVHLFDSIKHAFSALKECNAMTDVFYFFPPRRQRCHACMPRDTIRDTVNKAFYRCRAIHLDPTSGSTYSKLSMQSIDNIITSPPRINCTAFFLAIALFLTVYSIEYFVERRRRRR